MFKRYSLVFMLTIGLAFQGCAAPKPTVIDSDIGSERENEIYKEIRIIKVDVERLHEQIDTFKESNQQPIIENEKEIARVIERNQLLNQEVNKLREDNETLKKKLLNIQIEVNTVAPVPPEAEKDIGTLKIKVLCGDGDLDYAVKMAEKLQTFGYKIPLIDKAPRSNFKVTTLYFKPNTKNEVKRLGSKLGIEHILKPLSWSSGYNIIVVTSKNEKPAIKD
jgi:hypothetical protein